MLLWAELQKEVMCKCPKAPWAFLKSCVEKMIKKTRGRPAVERFLLVFVSSKVSAEQKKNRNENVTVWCCY